VISIADLGALRTNPQVAYDGYDELRAAARRRNGGLADPREIPLMRDLIRRRGADWCMSVIGKPMMGGLESVSGTDADMLMVADERDMDPPKPAWLIQWTQESDAVHRLQEEARAAALERDRERWAEALAASGVLPDQLEVRENTRSRQVRGGQRQALRHVVPLVDVRSPQRRHQSGRELCAVSRPRELGEPADQPATCVSCVAFVAQIRPDRRASAG
jgi:hypothetical protein